MKKEKLVLVGNGMAGIRAIEEVLKLAPGQFDITVFGEEPFPNYDRIQLSKVLQGDTEIADITLNSWEWYEENGISLYTGECVTAIDTSNQTLMTDKERHVTYDKLIIATGSVPFMLPLPGADKEGVTAFRNIKDCEEMLIASANYKKAVVIGGGLLGLEAARGLLNLGMKVDVVHLSNCLMERQLDQTAGKMLRKELEQQGMNFLMEKQSAEITGDQRVKGLKFSDGEEVEADLVVMAVGIKPNMALAKQSGIAVNRGIVVNDFMETSAPNVFAVGECAEHEGAVYGLVAPLYQQGKELAKRICLIAGEGYHGSVLSTQLKVSGVDVFSAGKIEEDEDTKTIKVFDDWRGIYQKVLVDEGKITGAVLFGDTKDGNRLLSLINKQAPVEDYLEAAQSEGSGLEYVASLPAEEIICGCNGVTKGAIVDSITSKGLTTFEQVKGCTSASRSCGGCKSLVTDVLACTLGDTFEENQQESICECTNYSKDEVIEAIKEKGLTHTREVMNVLGWASEEGCSKCRPALNYYLGMLKPLEYKDEKESRFVNERLRANIQKDGTYGVVPRMYGGVTNSKDLRKIADVADKYQVKLIKVTGGQRIDLLGVKKEDLPSIWAELDMPSGAAYSKGLRTVKTCVGADFCRFGTSDSIGLGTKLEKKFEGMNAPHKVKMSVSACPRNCAEGAVKDVGVIGLEGEFEIYVGGNAGTHMRQAELLAKVKTEEEVLETTAAFLQYYRETANYLDRTSVWVERMGIDHIKEVLADKKTFRELNQRMDETMSVVQDGWKEVLEDKEMARDLFENVKVPMTIK